ncbi:MAG: hypothetical protein EXS35_11845 [Pedosphaera sp.]|nr:hypothetical protein [Pedosphaera sp.]
MIELRIKDFAGRSKFLTGATVGEEHRSRAAEAVLKDAGESDQMVVILNFDGVDFATASYFKAAVLGLAKENVRSTTHSELSMFPVVHNLSEDLGEELTIVCRSEWFPCLEATKYTQKGLLACRLHGEIDGSLKRTLQLLQSSAPATAASLAEQSPDEKVNVTAWNNRLAELFRLRLTTRYKEGRFWKYEPVTKEITYG